MTDAKATINYTDLPAPDTMVRCKDGSEIALMFYFATEGQSLTSIAYDQGFDVKVIDFETAPNASRLQRLYFERGVSFDYIRDQWMPAAPDGFSLAAKLEVEDGPFAMFVRRKSGRPAQ